MTKDEEIADLIERYRATPMSDEEDRMLKYLYACEKLGVQPNIVAVGMDRAEAERAIVGLKIRGMVEGQN